MSGFVPIGHFDDEMTQEELSSETRLARAARRISADQNAAMRNIDAAIRCSESRTLRIAMSAVGQAMREERAEHRRSIAALHDRIAALERRLEALEREAPAARRRTAMSAVRGKAENICSH
jgi:hypothetical protein